MHPNRSHGSTRPSGEENNTETDSWEYAIMINMHGEVHQPRWFGLVGRVVYHSSTLSVALWQLVDGLQLTPWSAPPPPPKKEMLGGQLNSAVAAAHKHPWGPDGSEIRSLSLETLDIFDKLVKLRNRVVHDWWTPDTTTWNDGMVGHATASQMVPHVWTRVQSFGALAHVLNLATIAAQRTGDAVRELNRNGLTRSPTDYHQPYRSGVRACRDLINEWAEMQNGGRDWVWLDHRPDKQE